MVQKGISGAWLLVMLAGPIAGLLPGWVVSKTIVLPRDRWALNLAHSTICFGSCFVVGPRSIRRKFLLCL